jgi:hypothetical protein
MTAFDDLLEEACNRLRAAGMGTPENQLYAAVRCVEFMRGCRVADVTVSVQVNDPDKDPDWYYKCKLSGTMNGKRLSRMITVTSSLSPIGHLFSREGSPLDNKRHAILAEMVPEDQWRALREQFSELAAHLRDDGTIDRRISQVRDKVFQEDRRRLIFRMASLQRRGWRLPDVVECWNEALVEEVMKA